MLRFLMHRGVYRTILVSAFLVACPRFMVSQEQPTTEPKLTQSEAETLITLAKPKADWVTTFKALASEEEALEQSSRRIAAIYREMAVPSKSDSASAREQKHQYERLAENEESSASSAKRMAKYHARLAVLIEHSPDAEKTRNLLQDKAYRR
jgi:hypothetical protein